MKWLIKDLKFIAGVLLCYSFALTLGLLISRTDKASASGPLDMRCAPSGHGLYRCENQEVVCYFINEVSCIPKTHLSGLK